jgi:hypothetical protein
MMVLVKACDIKNKDGKEISCSSNKNIGFITLNFEVPLHPLILVLIKSGSLSNSSRISGGKINFHKFKQNTYIYFMQ